MFPTFSHNYTYPAVSRVKRSIFEDVLFQFKIASPSFEWRHSLGNRVNGGNFGLKFHNSIEGLFRMYLFFFNNNIDFISITLFHVKHAQLR